MFDIGWTELLVVACVAIIVVGPKDLPKLLRTFGKTMSSLRRMASDFQGQFDEALKEAELDEVKNLAKGKFSALEDIKKSTREFEADFKKQMDEKDAEIKAASSDGAPNPAPLASEPSKHKSLAEQHAEGVAQKAKAEKAAAATQADTSSVSKSPAKPAAPKASAAKSGSNGTANAKPKAKPGAGQKSRKKQVAKASASRSKPA